MLVDDVYLGAASGIYQLEALCCNGCELFTCRLVEICLLSNFARQMYWNFWLTYGIGEMEPFTIGLVMFRTHVC